MRTEDIPRREERLVIAKFTRDLLKLTMERFRGHMPPAEFVEYFWAGRAVWIATMSGHDATVQEVARQLGMTRNKCARKLDYLVHRGLLVKDGHGYVVSDEILADANVCNLDNITALITDTADKLRAVSKMDSQPILSLYGKTPSLVRHSSRHLENVSTKE